MRQKRKPPSYPSSAAARGELTSLCECLTGLKEIPRCAPSRDATTARPQGTTTTVTERRTRATLARSVPFTSDVINPAHASSRSSFAGTRDARKAAAHLRFFQQSTGPRAERRLNETSHMLPRSAHSQRRAAGLRARRRRHG